MRELEVAIRWSEVHIKRLFDYQARNIALDAFQEVFFELKNTYFFQVNFEYHCVNLQGVYTYCPHSTYDRSCVRGIWVPVLNVYMELYKDDLVLTIPFLNDSIKKIREGLTFLYEHPPPRCICGRLGKTHEIESENGKCNYCYIYGYVRGENCAICLADDGKPWVKTSCNHYFHKLCWTNLNRVIEEPKCPLCRSEQEFVEEV